MSSGIQCHVMEYSQRGLLGIKAGISGYRVIGEIDVQALRHFQRSHCSPAKSFNAVRDGFEIDFGHRLLQVGEME